MLFLESNKTLGRYYRAQFTTNCHYFTILTVNIDIQCQVKKPESDKEQNYQKSSDQVYIDLESYHILSSLNTKIVFRNSQPVPKFNQICEAARFLDKRINIVSTAELTSHAIRKGQNETVFFTCW